MQRSDSRTGIDVIPVGDGGYSTRCEAGPGSGNSRVMICMATTPCAKQSSLLVYMGGSLVASGDMYAIVPGHWVRGVIRGVASISLDIPKSVTLALLPAISRTLLLERSRWMMPLEWR